MGAGVLLGGFRVEILLLLLRARDFLFFFSVPYPRVVFYQRSRLRGFGAAGIVIVNLDQHPHGKLVKYFL